MISGATHERSSQISVNNTTPKTTAKLTKSCACERLDYNQVLFSVSGLAIVWDYNLHFKKYISKLNTTRRYTPTKNKKK